MNPEQIRIYEYLRAGLMRGQKYFKAKYIAQDLGMTSKVVGANLSKLSQLCNDLSIGRYAKAKASATWRVTAR